MKLKPIIEVEDEIYSFEPADNGAGPLWCSGSTIVARCGDLVVLASFACPDRSGPVYRLAQLASGGTLSEWVEVPLAHPFSGTFFTNTGRGGSRPSSCIDLVGTIAGALQTLRYARVRLDEPEEQAG